MSNDPYYKKAVKEMLNLLPKGKPIASQLDAVEEFKQNAIDALDRLIDQYGNFQNMGYDYLPSASNNKNKMAMAYRVIGRFQPIDLPTSSSIDADHRLMWKIQLTKGMERNEALDLLVGYSARIGINQFKKINNPRVRETSIPWTETDKVIDKVILKKVQAGEKLVSTHVRDIVLGRLKKNGIYETRTRALYDRIRDKVSKVNSRH
ncbi:hypothetical protein ACFL17_06545 [Pseudomonadota bacterium]